MNIPVLVRHDKARAPIVDRFIIDTGSPVSLVSKSLARRLQLPDSVMEFNQEFQGVTGETVNTARIDGFGLTLKGENNERLSCDQSLYINPQHPENILGMDFLENNGLKLVIKTARQAPDCYLEK